MTTVLIEVCDLVVDLRLFRVDLDFKVAKSERGAWTQQSHFEYLYSALAPGQSTLIRLAVKMSCSDDLWSVVT